jgi:hypothetical protein
MTEWCVRVAILVAAEAAVLVLVGVLSDRAGSPKGTPELLRNYEIS